MGVHDEISYNWRTKLGGLFPSELRRMQQLEEENPKLKRLVSGLSSDRCRCSVQARNRTRLPFAWRSKCEIVGAVRIRDSEFLRGADNSEPAGKRRYCLLMYLWR